MTEMGKWYGTESRAAECRLKKASTGWKTDMLTVVRSRLQKESTFSFILRQINFATKVLCGWQQMCFFFAGWLILVVAFAPRIWQIFWMLKRIQQTNTFLLPNKSESVDLSKISFSNKTIHMFWSHQRNAEKTLILVKFLLRVVFSRFTHCCFFLIGIVFVSVKEKIALRTLRNVYWTYWKKKKWLFSVCVTDMCLHCQIRFSHFHPIVLFRLEPWISPRRRTY